ncbi:MAG: sorbosone dehydrogenase family protein [Paracoccus sp. (in: a-proteobacteria)]|uniref:PQQ-dependent sugar dehydrogenase n=1 Tax=Paracoccus sp. TaxID=267 RepID=UPI0026DFACE5|nr:sorbosone dehydrogenase family protein [Paracoccus sp. (in: a-proteobacteria)]MDO5632390.1 sorbosone dehydrogenase family protein [Paracoccus sp. (in: a-proteobacteria)]
MKTHLTAALLALSIAAPALAQQTPILDAGPQGWQADTVADGLDYPWDIVADGDRLIITEKAGQIVIITDGQSQRFPVETSAPLRTDGGAGLMGIALAPDFAASGRAFVYYAYDNGGPLNRVAEVSFDGAVWRETAVLIDAIPGHRLYNGGRIAIGPDGYLYAATGWTENRERPQDLQSLAGKILRVGLDGAIPADNPFPNSPVWSYGHRNPQGLAWNAAGELFAAEHGQAALDEVNLIRPGANYGWPLVSGDDTRDGMEPPFIHSGRTTWAPSGIAFAGDELLVTALRGSGLLVMDRDKRALTPVADTGERYRQVLPVGDDLYVITTNRSPRGSGPSQDRLLRLSPSR